MFDGKTGSAKNVRFFIFLNFSFQGREEEKRKLMDDVFVPFVAWAAIIHQILSLSAPVLASQFFLKGKDDDDE